MEQQNDLFFIKINNPNPNENWTKVAHYGLQYNGELQIMFTLFIYAFKSIFPPR